MGLWIKELSALNTDFVLKRAVGFFADEKLDVPKRNFGVAQPAQSIES